MTAHAAATAGITRRRFIAISAAAAAACPVPARAAAPDTYRWHGVALGAQASMTLQHPDKAFALAAIDASLAEVARLEEIFSLYRPSSALQRLNTAGVLDDTPADLRQLMSSALSLAQRTNGAFDPTIQPLWSLYARHFAVSGAKPEGPSAGEIDAARRLVDWRKIDMDGATIRFAVPGMAVSLNGIAQGYISDRVGDVLKARGFEHVLVNMGEQLALGPKYDGKPWQVAVSDAADATRTITSVPLTNGAVATSGGYGAYFDQARRFTHILDPSTGSPAHHWSSVTVLTASATLADGLSTALTAAPASEARRILGTAARAYAVPSNAAAGLWL